MLRIGQFTDTFIPVVDGVGRVSLAYAETLCKMGHQVTVVTPQNDTGYRGGYPFELLEYYGTTVPGIRQYKTGESNLDIHYRQRIKQIPLDIVHAHSPFKAGSDALRLAVSRHIPLVSTFHSKYYDDFLKTTKSEHMAQLGVKFIVDFYNRCDEVWAVGHDTAQVLHDYGYQGEIYVMPNGVNIREKNEKYIPVVEEMFAIPEQEKLLLFVGQMNWKKNILKILEAAQLLREAGETFTLLLAGRGPDEKEIDKKIADMHIGHFVRRIGHQTDLNVLDGLYQRASLFVFPSLYDNAPMVLREAAAMYTPAVMVRGSSAAEVIENGKNGFLCEDDSRDLARVIREAISDGEKLRRVGKEARDTIPVSWDTVMEQVVERYERLIAYGREGRLVKKNTRFI